MGVETATFISQLSATNPLATDPISEGDDQIRLVKDVLQKQFTTLGAAAVTTTAAELNILDTVTATATELNYLDITTLGTSEASKVVTADANGDVTIADGAYDFDVASHDGTNGLLLGGTLVTATATELNLIDGYTGTTAELNYNDITTLGTAEASKTLSASSGSAVILSDFVTSRPVIKDYAETVYAGGDTATAKTLDETNGNVQTWTMTGNCTFTMPSGSGLQPGTSMTLILTQDGTGSRTGTFTSVKWAGASAPTLTTTATTGIDIITFYTFNGGASPVWYGFAAGLAMAAP